MYKHKLDTVLKKLNFIFLHLYKRIKADQFHLGFYFYMFLGNCLMYDIYVT